MNSISALITVISIIFLSILEINGCTKSKIQIDNQREKTLLNKVDSLARIQKKTESVGNTTTEQQDQLFRKL